MKKIIPILMLSSAVSFAFGAPDEAAATNATMRQDAIQLLRQGKAVDAKGKVAATLSSAPGNGNKSFDAGQQWVRIAFHFFGSGEVLLARQAATEAVAFADANSHETGFDAQRSSFLCNVGLACERILHDDARAKSFYAAALIAQPSNGQAKERQTVVEGKITRRSTGKGAGS